MRFEFYDSRDPQELDFDVPGVKVVNYASAKGLEFDTVFLPELQAVTDDPHGATLRMRFYVLVSRARDSLYLMYSSDTEPPVIQDMPPDLLEGTLTGSPSLFDEPSGDSRRFVLTNRFNLLEILPAGSSRPGQDTMTNAITQTSSRSHRDESRSCVARRHPTSSRSSWVEPRTHTQYF